MATTKDQIEAWFKQLQDEICAAIEEADGRARFQEETWSRPGGGGGRTRVMENGAVIEKGGVNFSAVHGVLPDKIKAALGVETEAFFATGVSIVMHPGNPHVPIVHMNVRYFEMSEDTWWFGGGIDLTPHYVVEEDAQWFHGELERVCEKHDPSYYSRFSEWANRYFYIKHRKESRGVSGIFFDRLNTQTEGRSKEDILSFVQDVGKVFAPIYTQLMHRYADAPVTELHKAWQSHRRSRYVEFNLVLDKGTKFGLDTDGRIDSILMSLPPSTGWKYTQHWPQGGEEERTEHYLRTVHVPKDSN